jgi:hypothetical protein
VHAGKPLAHGNELPRDRAVAAREVAPITLAPYGCARLRIAAFPFMEDVAEGS